MYSYPPYIYIIYIRGQSLSILLGEKLITHFLRRNVKLKDKACPPFLVQASVHTKHTFKSKVAPVKANQTLWGMSAG